MIPLGASNELGIRWQPRRVRAREGKLLSVEQALLVEVLDSGVHFHGKLSYRIQQGAVNKLRLRIPPDLALQSVHGPEVADWSIESEPATGTQPPGQRLVVSLKTELTTGTEVDIHAIRRDRQVTGAIDVHTLEPLGVVRETGRVAIGSSSHFGLRVDKAESVDQIDRMGWQLPQGPREGCAVLRAYRYTSRPWRLRLQVERQQSRVEVSDRTAVAVAAPGHLAEPAWRPGDGRPDPVVRDPAAGCAARLSGSRSSRRRLVHQSRQAGAAVEDGTERAGHREAGTGRNRHARARTPRKPSSPCPASRLRMSRSSVARWRSIWTTICRPC